MVPPTSYPFYAAESHGAHFTDVDGNDFIDYMCAFGPMVLGYDNEIVHAAAAAAARPRRPHGRARPRSWWSSPSACGGHDPLRELGPVRQERRRA